MRHLDAASSNLRSGFRRAPLAAIVPPASRPSPEISSRITRPSFRSTMPSELSMQMQDKAASERNFFPVSSGKFEPHLIKMFCEPLLPHIPARISPNSISLVTHAVVWTTAWLAVFSPGHAPLGRALALIGAGIGMFLSMIGDCVVGMHARRTGQTSKLGAVLDHWVDALVVPLAAIGISAALEMPIWAVITVNVTAVMIYNAQLVLYHHSREFVAPEPTTGVEAQFGLAIGYVALAGLFYCVVRHRPWLDMTVAALAIAGTFVQLRCSVFYYPKLGRSIIEHFWFVAMCGGWAAAFWLGAIDQRFFLLAITFTTFRICGTYVLRTLVDAPYDGRDYVLLAFIVTIFVVHFGLKPAPFAGMPITHWLTALSCAFAIARNLQDFSRHYGALKPRAA
jgi:phosphatidylglycerophosphate synthase